MGPKKGLMERMKDGEHVLVAEGFLFEVEQRGYMQAGHFVPEVAIEHPEVLRGLHEEFAHAGSDVVEAFTYYGQRAKVEIAGRADQVETLNRAALKLAKGVADDTNTLMAGNICNSTIFKPNNPQVKEEIEQMFKEQIIWAVEEGADFIIAETYFFLEEALIALDAIKKYGNGLPAVVTMAIASRTPNTYEGVPIWDACKKIEDAGADIVGINCFRGPATTLPYMAEIRKACKGPLACLPVPYRTNETWPRMTDLKDPTTGKDCFPGNLNPWHCSRYEIEDFTKKAKDMGIQYLGLCCGNQAHYMRTMAETLGRSPPASKYSPDMTLHFSRIEGERFKSEREMFAVQYE